MEIHMLTSGAGDCFFIHYLHEGIGRNIWVDGGLGSTYRAIKKKLAEIKARNEVIDLLVITHIDSDHIRGVLKFFADDSIDHTIIKRVLFNCASIISGFLQVPLECERETLMKDGSTACSFSEGTTLEQVLRNLGLLERLPIQTGDIVRLPGANLYILSPDKESLKKLNQNWEKESAYGDTVCSVQNDYHLPFSKLKDNLFQPDTRPANQASIAFLLEQDDKKVLMLADSNPEVIVESLHKMKYNEENRLRVDYVKLAHHGSCKNTSDALLRILDCRSYLISSNRSDCPSKETLARIVQINKHPIFLCNYEKTGILLPCEVGLCTIEKKCEVRF